MSHYTSGRTLPLSAGALLLAGLLTTGCEPPCGTTGNGTLVVNVSGLPAGISARIAVDGPGGSNTVTTTQTLTVRSGAYTVAANAVAEASAIVRKAYDGAPSSSAPQVCDGQTTTVEVPYALIPTSNKLWWSNQNGTSTVLGYAAANLGASGTPGATVAANSKSSGALAFDRHGNLWQVDGIAGSAGVERYAAGTFTGGGSKTPDVVITSTVFNGGFPGPNYLALDSGGNLWVSIAFSHSVVRIDAASLGASGSVTPAITISGHSGPLAFDKTGNLWVGDDDKLVKYAASRLSASTSAAPDVTITAHTGPPVTVGLGSLLGLAFDASGNLWANFDGSFARFTPTEQSTSADREPSVLITSGVTALPEGIAFDESGALWTALSTGKFGRYASSQLGASGTLTPEVIVTSADVAYAVAPAFFPAPASLPLFSALP